MDQELWIKAFSAARLERYVEACKGNWEEALTLYRANIRLSSSLLAILSIFEVTLRNAIDAHYSARFGPEWLRTQAAEGGFLTQKGCERTRESVMKILNHKLEQYSHERTVAQLSFPFWRCLFNKYEFYRAGETLMAVFPPKARLGNTLLDHRLCYKRLGEIKAIRNRIAHHDPICFSVKNKPSAHQPWRSYRLTRNFLKLLGYEPELMLHSVDFVQQEVDFIQALAKRIGGAGQKD